MFSIRYSEAVTEDLRALRAFDRKRMLDGIEKQLKHEPSYVSANRKPLFGLIPPWEHVEPVWELRMGDYRVFYDIDEEARVVMIRAVRRKPPHTTTEEIL